MKSLIPGWAFHYSAFWKAIHDRNDWFIRLRYLAVVILLLFLYGGEYLFQFNFSSAQFSSIFFISVIVLIYNILLQSWISKVGDDPEGFNCLHVSLIMIILDLTALMILVYLTGLSQSPLYILFIFHMIIGSLILPGYINYIIAGLISISFMILIFLQHEGIIYSQQIIGLIKDTGNNDYLFELSQVTMLSFVLFVSVYFTNKIARQLYKQEQQLRQSLEQLSDAEKAKQKYTIGVVHEIKTPIVASKSILDLILGKYLGPVDPKIEEKLNRAQRRNEEALELINDVLKFSRLKLIDVGFNDIIDLEVLIARLIDDQLETMTEKNVRSEFYDVRINKKQIVGNLLLMELALSNLISNAAKYAINNGNISIILSDNDDSIQLEISDNGIGIPETELSNIFNQFYRASNVDRTKIEGSGMGLSIVKEIIERHGGKIKVQSPSKIGNKNAPGTTFIITLPLIQRDTSLINATSNPED